VCSSDLSYTIDQWISLSQTDKAYTDFGLDINRNPIGTWFIQSQITDKNYWEKEIKLNKKYAYSIEALMNLSIIKMSKMEKEQIVLPDGEHLINGTIYVVSGGVVVETKEVTSEQEEVIEDVVTENMEEAPVVEEKPIEEVLEETPIVPIEETPVVEDDRIAKLEKQHEDLLLEIAKMKGEMEAPKLDELPIEMSDNRPMWRKISDAINANKNQKYDVKS
jgi:hypothetical protein